MCKEPDYRNFDDHSPRKYPRWLALLIVVMIGVNLGAVVANISVLATGGGSWFTWVLLAANWWAVCYLGKALNDAIRVGIE